MSKKKRREPEEIPLPSKEPEILPETVPDDPLAPGEEPEIVPEKEPDEPSSPAEIPNPGQVS
jgi:hypothetical protein